MALIIDIETIGADFDALDQATKDNLTRWIRHQAGDDGEKYYIFLKDLKAGLGFSPLTGEIAAIGVFDTEKNQGVVYFQAPDREIAEYSDAGFSFKPKTEAEMLKAFWHGARQYDKFVTFNGRSFDIPFILVRGAAHKIKPALNLMSNRYLNSQFGPVRHIDLLDQFSFYGAARRRGNLHLYCRAFGIRSPKAAGITGDDISRLFKEKKYTEIAEYNSWDLIAIWELYKVWQEYIQA